MIAEIDKSDFDQTETEFLGGPVVKVRLDFSAPLVAPAPADVAEAEATSKPESEPQT